MFERFTDRSRRALVLAQEEARDLNHAYIGTEHLLLGLIREGKGIASQLLTSLDVTSDQVRSLVAEVATASDSPPSGAPPFTPRAKKVLELSLREALELGHSYIGTEHILLGLIRQGEGRALTILTDLGADTTRIRGQVLTIMSERQGRDEASEDPTVASPAAAPPMAFVSRPLDVVEIGRSLRPTLSEAAFAARALKIERVLRALAVEMWSLSDDDSTDEPNV